MKNNFLAVQGYVTAMLRNPGNSLNKMNETPENIVAIACEIDHEVQKQVAANNAEETQLKEKHR